MLYKILFVTNFFLSIYVNSFLFDDGQVSVHTPVGTIIGFTSTFNITGTQKLLNTFLGIPYAKPPTGGRRFTKPVPKENFKGDFQALDYGPACFQYREGQPSSKNITFSEDCLSLNIFAPDQQLDGASLYPVMLFIHGGGFVTGYSIGYEGRHLSLGGDVIVVTMNYRLNVFGFLSTGDGGAAGNYGLWDQQLAIEWVHNNIRAFGGDPNRVTIFGESAGAAAVTFQTIYPGNKGLFQRAIAESGSFAGPWAFSKRTDVQNFTRQFATVAECSQQDSAGIIRCLQSKPAMAIKKLMDGPLGDLGLYMWSPVIDNEFIFNEPIELLTQNYPSKPVEDMFLGIDLIMGVNSKEGFSDFPRLNETFRPDFSKADIDDKLIPRVVKEFPYNNKDIPDSVVVAAVVEYTDWDNLDEFNRQVDRFTDLITDYWFNVGASLTARKHTASQAKHTYVYKLSLSPPQHLLPVFNGLDGPTVANHADELVFLFGFEDGLKIPNGVNKTITDAQKNIGKAMITMWTNFAKTG